MSDAILEVKDLKKAYLKRIILDKVSFSVFRGEIVGIVGANGCGKSTLLRILAGADKPSSGTIEYSGQNPFKNKNLFTRYVGYIPQDNPLFDNLTVIDNLKLWYCDNTSGIEQVMNQFGLTPYAGYTVRKLSGGMKKRLSIACSIANNPPVLILDEPGASLDIVCKSDICRYFLEYREKGGTVIITSHEENELSLCDRMLLIEDTAIREIEPSTSDKLMQLISKEDFHA